MLKQKIQEDVKTALKAGDSSVAGVLRLTLASIASREKEKRYAISKKEPNLSENELVEKSHLSDDEVVSVLSSEVKKRKDAIALYEQGKRPELAEKEHKEIEIIKKYLPAQLSAEEIKKMVEESISTTGAESLKDMGKVMADVSPKIKGKADGGEVSKIVKELLSK